MFPRKQLKPKDLENIGINEFIEQIPDKKIA